MKRLGLVPVIAMLVLALAGCSDAKKDDAAPTPAPSVTQAAPTAAATAAAVAGLDPANSQTITDGICTTLIPYDWVESGNGRGTSPSGARFTLFGNILPDDAAWTAAVGIVATLAAGKGAATAGQTADSVTFANKAGTSFETRRRIDGRYCDFSVSSLAKAPDDERALWPAIGASMTAASETP